VLDLSALDGVVDYRPAELVLTALAGTRLAAIEALLADHGQRLAFEPPDPGLLLGASGGARMAASAAAGTEVRSAGSTIGGVLATNQSGSRRVTAGAARDHFLGVTAVNGRGETFRAGGKVVKNVTGYDLPKLLAGSWGTLAVMSEVTLKVVPAAETERTLILPDREPGAAVATLTAALGSAHEVSSAGFDPWRGSLLRLEGLGLSVAARAAALLRELGNPDVEVLEGRASRELWARHAGAEALADWRVVWRISVPPADAPRVLGAIAPERYLLDWGGGLIWAAYDAVDAARVRSAIADGHALLFKAPADSKPCRLQPPGAALGQALERVRDAFDPDRRLNPGRMD
jgi:glycolate oxidase FAD binding subunit